jgi:penicillin-binding protein 1A
MAASWTRRLLRWTIYLGLSTCLLGVLGIAVAYWLLAPSLPDTSQIRDIRLQVPLRVYSADGKLIALFGETKRTPVKIEAIPQQLRRAVMAIEDARFLEHHGIDFRGIGRAVWLLTTTDRDRVPGGSTITQQVARNFFLSNEYSVTRKASEIFLALKMERELSKDEILGLYLNKIFFGYRCYGVGAAAEFYYGKTLDQLTLAESAMLASIPKFPSTGNPLTNPDRAKLRRDYVLQRMFELGWIAQAEMLAAQAEPDRAHPHEPAIELDAPYVAEMVRVEAIERLGADALNNGYRAYTSLDSRLQEAANAAVRTQLMQFDHRYGYRGAEAKVPAETAAQPELAKATLSTISPVAGLTPALVTEVSAESGTAMLADGQSIALDLAAVAWARTKLAPRGVGPRPTRVNQVLQPGDVIRVVRTEAGGWQLAQVPLAQAALAALDPEDGALRALVGGFNFSLSKFNRATQSNRQPGSSFKPFVYSAAFERGFTPASIVNDAPLSFPDPSAEGGVWKPQNDNEDFNGPMRLREAMVSSRNLISVRLLDAIGVRYAREYIQRFGFPEAALPENLSLALGTSSVSPVGLARGYATFANGGYLVEPYLITRIEDDQGKALYEARPARACRRCPERVTEESRPMETASQDLTALLDDAPTAPATAEPAPIDNANSIGTENSMQEHALAPRKVDERNAFLITTLLRDVVLRGTGRTAMVLERHDLGGKTGTTNNHRDAWFSGFNGSLVATVWMGHDDFTPLGEGEFAARTALPIWIDFMRVALAGVPETPLEVPPGISTARISASGHLLDGSVEGGILEYFKSEDLLKLSASEAATDADQNAEQQALDLF